MRIAPPLENSSPQPTYCHFKFLKRVELSMEVKRLFPTVLENFGIRIYVYIYVCMYSLFNLGRISSCTANRVKLVV